MGNYFGFDIRYLSLVAVTINPPINKLLLMTPNLTLPKGNIGELLIFGPKFLSHGARAAFAAVLGPLLAVV